MLRESISVVIGAVVFVAWTISSIDSRANRVQFTYTCPTGFAMALNGTDKTKSICWKDAGLFAFYDARLVCRNLSGYLMYMEDALDVTLLASTLKLPHWIGIWNKDKRRVWDYTGRTIEPTDFHRFSINVSRRSNLRCAYSPGTAGALWNLRSCDDKIQTYCRARMQEEPSPPLISFTPTYPGAQLRDMIKGENLRVECEATLGNWGELAFLLWSPMEIFRRNDPNTRYRTIVSGNTTKAVLTLQLFPVDKYNGKTMACTSVPFTNKPEKCRPSDTHCAILGRIQISSKPRQRIPSVPMTTTAAPPEKSDGWLNPETKNGILVMVAGFFVGLILGTFSLEMYLRRQEGPAVAEETAGKVPHIGKPGAAEKTQQAGSVVESQPSVRSDRTSKSNKSEKSGEHLENVSHASALSAGTHSSKRSKK